ncbi:MAG: DUF3014 domain-containing protein [Thermoanaerobaculia bacterium]
MSELEEVRLERSRARGGGPGGGGGFRWGWLVALVVIIAAAVAAWLLLSPELGEEAPADAEPPAEEVTPPPEPGPEAVEEPAELPPLEASDELVRRLAQGLSRHPELSRWLATDDLVQRFVLLADNLAVGLVPREEVPIRPEGEFRAQEAEDGGPRRIDPASYDRYDTAAAIFASLDTEGTVELYRRLQPLVDAAAQERLGYGAERFDETLRRAVLHLLETPVPTEPPAVQRRAVAFEYVDPRLEDLSDAQKQLLRMGPENQRAVQQKLRAMARELGLPDERIPDERTIEPQG